MARKEMELFLVKQTHPLYTARVDTFISNKCKKTLCDELDDDDIVVIWHSFDSHFEELEDDASENDEEESEIVELGLLTKAGRSSIKTYLNNARSYLQQLSLMEDIVFKEYHDSITVTLEAKKRAQMHERATKNDQFSFFEQPSAKADFKRWFELEVWNVEEATALSFGKEPTVVDSKSLATIKPTQASNFKPEYEHRLRVINAAVSSWSVEVAAESVGVRKFRKIEANILARRI